MVLESLINAKDSEKAGHIAVVEPDTGEILYGQSVVETAKEGRRVKKDPKAVFLFVRVSYPSVHVLRSVVLPGHIGNEYFPI